MTATPPSDTVELTSEQVLTATVDTLEEHLHLVVQSDTYTNQDIWRVLACAAARTSTVEDTTRQLDRAPCANTVRNHLKAGLLAPTELAQLEADLNAALVAQLPPRIQGRAHRVGLDLVLLPYYGEPEQDAQELRRSKAQRGTTRFHCYATVYVIKHHKRVTLAVTYVRADDTLLAVLTRLLARLVALQVGIRRLYLDRQFYAVALLRYLKTQPFPSVIPARVHGKRIQALCRGRKSYQTTYTVGSPTDGSEEVNLWIVCRYAKGKRGKHQVEYLPYVVIGDLSCPTPSVREEHRGRFGIETSYRLMNQARIRTTCRNPKYRLLVVGLAWIMINIWITLQWEVLSVPRRGGRWLKRQVFPLSSFREFVVQAVEAIYGRVAVVQRPAALARASPP